MPNARSVTLFFYTAMPNFRSAILFFRNAMPNGADDTIISSVPGNIKMKSLFFLTILLLPDDYPIPVFANALKKVWGGSAFLAYLRQ